MPAKKRQAVSSKASSVGGEGKRLKGPFPKGASQAVVPLTQPSTSATTGVGSGALLQQLSTLMKVLFATKTCYFVVGHILPNGVIHLSVSGTSKLILEDVPWALYIPGACQPVPSGNCCEGCWKLWQCSFKFLDFNGLCAKYKDDHVFQQVVQEARKKMASNPDLSKP
eukprot:1857665-Amphidinium_carterae.1